jgi:thiol-disulfide isomerase/thioredoxin
MSAPRLLVACLCAEWCGTCRQYAAPFAQEAAAFDEADFFWVDIEDDAEAVEGLEVENFPTLLIARGNEVLFIGAVTPHVTTMTRLLQAARDGDLEPLAAGPGVGELPARVRRFGTPVGSLP